VIILAKLIIVLKWKKALKIVISTPVYCNQIAIRAKIVFALEIGDESRPIYRSI
jgi:hypothetical protein